MKLGGVEAALQARREGMIVVLIESLWQDVRQLMAQGKIFSSAHDRPLLARVHVVLVRGEAGIQTVAQTHASQLKLLMWISALVLLIACANRVDAGVLAGAIATLAAAACVAGMIPAQRAASVDPSRALRSE
ncbi:MAG: permease [Edaphobacter sp.]|nr:permease [Edaphobacter sp.]